MTNENDNGVDKSEPRFEVNLAKLQSTMPAFYALNVRLWLKQVDAHFQIHGAKSDNHKFNLLHVQLRPEMLTQVADVIENPPDQDKYIALKEIDLGLFRQRAKTAECTAIWRRARRPQALGALQ